MDISSMLTSLGMGLFALGWICAAGAFFDLAVIRPLLRLYTSSIQLAESRGKFFSAAQLQLMVSFLQRLEGAISFITCWGIARRGAGVLARRLAGRSAR